MDLVFSRDRKSHVRGVLATLYLVLVLPSFSGPLIELPTSDQYYRAIVNATVGIDRYLDNLPAEALITDLTIYSDPGIAGLSHMDQMQRTYQEVSGVLALKRPRSIVGTYHSSRDVDDRTNTYPPRGASPSIFRSEQLITYHPAPVSIHYGRHYVDYSRLDAQAQLIQQVASDVAATGRPLLFLDNVAHSCAGWPIPWSTTLAYLGELRKVLHAQGIRVIANVAWAIGGSGCAESSAAELVNTGVDGIALEMPLTDEVRSNSAQLMSAIKQYRTLLDAGLTVILVSTADDTARSADSSLLAAFGLMLRRPGDKLFVAWPFFSPAQNWFYWPADFGAPRGSPSVAKQPNGNLVMERAFERARVTVNVTSGEVSVQNAVQQFF